MQAVCDVLEQLVSEGALKRYAIGGATAAGFHKESIGIDLDDGIKANYTFFDKACPTLEYLISI
jgi:hypothetical protein